VTSIRKALLGSLIPAVLCVLALAVAAVLLEVRDEIDELFDAQLMQAADAVPVVTPSDSPDPQEDDPRSSLVIAVWAGDSQAPAYHSRTRVALKKAPTPGFSYQHIDGEKWRVFSREDVNHTILAAQPLRVRNEAANDIASRVMLPMLLLVPVLVLTVLFLLKRGLRPLTRFTAELDARSPRAMDAVPLDALPAELRPMGLAMNQLLGRLEAALNAQQVFIADAAHELLTPLTALQVQVQMLERAKSAERREQTMQDVRMSLERCINLARQLLTLARHSTEPPSDIFRPLALGTAVRAAMSEVLPKAIAREIDLGIAAESPAMLSGDIRALQVLLANLLDNAIKYSPTGTRVDVSIEQREGGTVVTISDMGPGISVADRTRVFDRFYRATGTEADGSGLGLAIAREIAARHGAQIVFESPGSLGGLDVEIKFPASAERSHAPMTA
jgi:two-component system OmpR family sensor kinase